MLVSSVAFGQSSEQVRGFKMAKEREREILREFIELYSDCPCLWDFSSDVYKDKNQKGQAWDLLVEKLKLIEPEANVATAKKKVEHMRTAYKREAKKVKESKRTGSGASEVHVPNLWYYNLMSFLDKKSEQERSGVETLSSDEESQQIKQSNAERNSGARKICASDRGHNSKRQRLIDTAQKLLQQEQSNRPNSFAVYIGEQLEQLSTYQRQVAEKLISEVIFLAKTENLNFDSKIETHSMSRNYYSHSDCSYSQSPSPQISQPSPSPHIMQPSPSHQYILSTPLPQVIVPSPAPRIQSPPSPQIQQSHSAQLVQPSPSSYSILTEEDESNNAGVLYEGCDKSILKDFLIRKPK